MVAMLAWPSISCTCRRAAPPATRCVAKLWRSVWGETPIGSLFIVEAKDRATVKAFCRVDPYRVDGVWETVEIHAFVSRRGWAAPDSKGV